MGGYSLFVYSTLEMESPESELARLLEEELSNNMESNEGRNRHEQRMKRVEEIKRLLNRNTHSSRLPAISEVNEENINGNNNNYNRNIHNVHPARNLSKLTEQSLYANNNNHELRARQAAEIGHYLNKDLTANPELALQYAFLRRIHEKEHGHHPNANGAAKPKNHGTRRNEAWGERASAVNIRAAGRPRRRKTRRTRKTRIN